MVSQYAAISITRSKTGFFSKLLSQGTLMSRQLKGVGNWPQGCRKSGGRGSWYKVLWSSSLEGAQAAPSESVVHPPSSPMGWRSSGAPNTHLSSWAEHETAQGRRREPLSRLADKKPAWLCSLWRSLLTRSSTLPSFPRVVLQASSGRQAGSLALLHLKGEGERLETWELLPSPAHHELPGAKQSTGQESSSCMLCILVVALAGGWGGVGWEKPFFPLRPDLAVNCLGCPWIAQPAVSLEIRFTVSNAAYSKVKCVALIMVPLIIFSSLQRIKKLQIHQSIQ